MAMLISREMGKPLWEAKTEVAAMIGKVGISIAAHTDRCPTSENINSKTGVTLATRHKPHGVAAILGPFNFPGHLPKGHIVPALIAGNTIVLKPSELTPGVADAMAALWAEADLPPGVLNVAHGGGEIGRILSEHDDIDALFFTGSYRTGLKLSKAFGAKPEKILALEMGGNNPLIVDTENIDDIDAAVHQTIQSGYITSGQRCTCARRLIITESKRAAQYIDALVAAIDEITIGHGQHNPQVFMGPLVSANAASGAIAGFDRLKQAGGTVLRALARTGDSDAFVTPGLVDTTGVDVGDSEVFAPLMQLRRVASFHDAIEEANNTAYGLSAGVFTDDEARYREFYHHARAGIINWNTPLTGASGAAPFGGVGHSGNHRPSAYYAADYCSYPVASMEAPLLRGRG
jgi:succinylglutamic semialdehyde dehydrogenase